MAAIKDIQIGEEKFTFNKLQSDNAVVEVVGDTINNFANKLQFGRYVDDSNSENLLVVGNGSGADSKSNALELTYNGELKAQTDVVVDEHRLTNKLDKEDFDLAEENDIFDILGVKMNTKIFLSDGNFMECDLDTLNNVGFLKFNGNYIQKLISTIIIGSIVTSIGDSAFEYCDTMTSVIIPNSVKNIGMCAFSNCSNLTNIIYPEKLTYIPKRCFEYCGLTDFTISDNVNDIGYSAFYKCKNLTKIVIPSGIKIIKTDTFYDCSSLTSVTLPETIEQIQSMAFSGVSRNGTFYCNKSWYDNLNSTNKSNLGYLVTNWTKVYI